MLLGLRTLQPSIYGNGEGGQIHLQCPIASIQSPNHWDASGSENHAMSEMGEATEHSVASNTQPVERTIYVGCICSWIIIPETASERVEDMLSKDQNR